MNAMALAPGQRVKVRRNDAHVGAGAEGRFLRVVPETGNLLIDVDGRGRVALTPDSVTTLAGTPVRTFRLAPAGPDDAPAGRPGPRRTLVKLSRELYLDGPDTAAELGIKPSDLKVMAAAIAVGRCTGRTCHYTARDIAALQEFQAFIREADVSPRMAAKLWRILQRMQAKAGSGPGGSSSAA